MAQECVIAMPNGLQDDAASATSSVPIMSDVLDTLYFTNFTKESCMRFLYDRWKRLKRYPLVYYRNCEFYKRTNFTGKGTLVLSTGAAALIMFLVKIWLIEWNKTSETVLAVSTFISFAISCLFMIFEPKKKEMRNETAGDCYEDLCEQLEIVIALQHAIPASTVTPENPENTSQDLAIELEEQGDASKNKSPGTPVRSLTGDVVRKRKQNVDRSSPVVVSDEEYFSRMVRYLMRRQRQLREKFEHISEAQLARVDQPVFPEHLLPEMLRPVVANGNHSHHQ